MVLPALFFVVVLGALSGVSAQTAATSEEDSWSLTRAPARGEALAPRAAERSAPRSLGAGRAELELARQLAQQGDTVGAEAAYRAWLARHPEDRDARLRTAELAEQLGRPEQALRDYARLLRARPVEPELVRRYVSLLRASGREQEARRLLEAALVRAPRSWGLLETARALFAEWGELARADSLLDALHRLRPRDSAVLGELAERALERGERERAVAYLRAVPRASGGQGQEQLAQLFAERDLLPEALEAARAAVLSAAHRTDALRLLASLLERAGQHAEAERTWTALLRELRSAERRLEVVRRLVSSWARTGQLEQRKAALQAAVGESPKPLEPALLLAAVYARDPRELTAELSLLELTLTHSPSSLEALELAFDAYVRAGDVERALVTLERMLEAEGDVSSRVARALAFARRHPREPRALSVVERCLAHAQREPAVQRAAAQFFLARGEPQQAADAFRRALALDPSDHEARLALASFTIGDPDVARHDLQRVLQGTASSAVRERALQQLLQLGPEEVENALLAGPLDRPRRAALLSLYEKQLLPSMRRAERGEASGPERARLESVIERASGALLLSLRDGSERERALALRLLSLRPSAGVRRALYQLSDQPARAISERASALAALAPSLTEQERSELQARFAREAATLRPLLLWMLASSAQHAEPALRAAALSDRDEGVQALAALLHGAHLLDVPPRLRELSHSRLPWLRASASWALLRLGETPPEPAPHEPPLSPRLAAFVLTGEREPERLVPYLYGVDETLALAAAERLTREFARVRLPPPSAPFDVEPYLASLSEATRARHATELTDSVWAAVIAVTPRLLERGELQARVLSQLRYVSGGLAPRALLVQGVCISEQQARSLAIALGPRLAALTNAPELALRAGALRALILAGRVEPEQLRAALQQGPSALREAALEALGELPAPPASARTDLGALLDSPAWPLRRLAARALRGHLPPHSLAGERVDLVREAAAEPRPPTGARCARTRGPGTLN